MRIMFQHNTIEIPCSVTSTLFFHKRFLQGIARHLINESADVLFILSKDEEALLAIVGAHRQGEHVKAGLRALKHTNTKM